MLNMLEVNNRAFPKQFFEKSSILDVLLGSKHASGFKAVNYFHQKMHFRCFRGYLDMPLHVIILAILKINEL